MGCRVSGLGNKGDCPPERICSWCRQERDKRLRALGPRRASIPAPVNRPFANNTRMGVVGARKPHPSSDSVPNGGHLADPFTKHPTGTSCRKLPHFSKISLKSHHHLLRLEFSKLLVEISSCADMGIVPPERPFANTRIGARATPHDHATEEHSGKDAGASFHSHILKRIVVMGWGVEFQG